MLHAVRRQEEESMLIKSLATVAIAVAAVLSAAGPAAAEPQTGPTYDVICIYETLPGGHPLPVVCLPYPLS